MTIEKVVDLFLDTYGQIFTIYDCDKGEEVFTGTLVELDDIDTELRYKEIVSMDNIRPDSPKVVFNINIF